MFPCEKHDRMNNHAIIYPDLAQSGLSLSEIARRSDVKRAAVSKWNRRGVPPSRAVAVASITGIPPHVLRPDIFPAPSNEICPPAVAAAVERTRNDGRPAPGAALIRDGG